MFQAVISFFFEPCKLTPSFIDDNFVLKGPGLRKDNAGRLLNLESFLMMNIDSSISTCAITFFISVNISPTRIP